MRAIVQRVSEAKVVINNITSGVIKEGFLILLGVTATDSIVDIEWLAAKIAKLRVFNDEQGLMNKSVQEIDGEILVVSQFTLYASTKKGNRPSFINAAKPEIAKPLYEQFITIMSQHIIKPIQTGAFGANMQVSLINNGPVTIIIDSNNKE